MTDPEYLDRAEALLACVEASCDRINESTDADVDNQRVGGMVTLTFADGSQIIVNLQKPLQEVWLAARSGGLPYQWGGRRRCGPSGAAPPTGGTPAAGATRSRAASSSPT